MNQDQDQDQDQDHDPGLAAERTRLAWSRTAISVAALGGVVLKLNVATGLAILVIAPLLWQIGRFAPSGSDATASPAARRIRIQAITASIVIVSILCLVVALVTPART